MSPFEAAIYGAVQGLTEYLPVSSSAHLILVPKFLSTEDPGLAFDVFLHFGTLAATLGYFWKDWVAFLKDPRAVLPLSLQKGGVGLRHLVIGTLPALAVGGLLHHWISENLRAPELLATTLVLGGLALWGIDLWAVYQKTKAPSTPDMARPMDTKIALGVGGFQCLALIPGMSRSGMTILGGRLFGLEREAAARFSFLLSAPVTAAAFVFELRKLPAVLHDIGSIWPLMVGAGCAFLFGVAAIRFLIRLVGRIGFGGFAVYRIALASIVWYFFV